MQGALNVRWRLYESESHHLISSARLPARRRRGGLFDQPHGASIFFAMAVLIAMSLQMVNVWQKLVILRIGRLQSVNGVGLFTIIPILDSVAAVIDVRIQTPLSMPSRR